VKPLRRLYDWVIGWADSPYALPALCVLSFTESSFFPIPPDVLLIPLCLGDRRKAWWFASWCTVASVVGGIFGYWLGHTLWTSGLDEFCYRYVPGFSRATFAHVQQLFEEWNFWVVFAAGFTPIPYKVFTIAAGVFDVSFVPFVLASIAGRGGRFFLVAALLYRYGAPIREFMERRLGLLSILATAMLVGGFLAIRLLT
jgi:membrane protein YqaA with SNARE-associated domain